MEDFEIVEDEHKISELTQINQKLTLDNLQLTRSMSYYRNLYNDAKQALEALQPRFNELEKRYNLVLGTLSTIKSKSASLHLHLEAYSKHVQDLATPTNLGGDFVNEKGRGDNYICFRYKYDLIGRLPTPSIAFGYNVTDLTTDATNKSKWRDVFPIEGERLSLNQVLSFCYRNTQQNWCDDVIGAWPHGVHKCYDYDPPFPQWRPGGYQRDSLNVVLGDHDWQWPSEVQAKALVKFCERRWLRIDNIILHYHELLKMSCTLVQEISQ